MIRNSRLDEETWFLVSSMHGNRDVDRDGRHLQRPRVEFSFRTNLAL